MPEAVETKPEVQSTLSTVYGPRGPVDRGMSPYIRKALESLSPSQYKQQILDNYNRNQTAWNTGALALGGLGLGAAAHGIRNAFRSDYDRRHSSGLSDAAAILLPMAILAGGGYLWNKYGDTVKGGLRDLADAKKDYQTYKKAKAKIGKAVRAVPGGDWAIRKVKEWVNS